MKCVILIIFVIAVALAASQDKAADTCSPLGGHCQVTDQCCHPLICLTYAAKCVSKGGVIVPHGEYKESITESYPSNVSMSELPQ